MANITVRPGGAVRHVPAPARRPSHADLTRWGLDPAWSRLVTFQGADGAPVTWHVLDTATTLEFPPTGTVVCVHGNPSWSYLWTDVLHEMGASWRVVAVDQTGMGFSERSGPRQLAERIDELVAFCAEEVEGPLVLMAHDWGGAIAVGASARLPVEAVILANTAVAKPDDVAVPPLIAAARRTVDLACRRTPAFVEGAAAMTGRSHRAALRAPYRTADLRSAVADFVADIPVTPDDYSAPALAGVADAFASLACPILLVWGGRDLVFHDRFLADLRRRRPDADVHRVADAAHYLPLDSPIGAIAGSWLDRTLRRERHQSDQSPPGATSDTSNTVGSDALPEPGSDTKPMGASDSLLAQVDAHRGDGTTLYRGPEGALTWDELAVQSDRVAAHLAAAGVRVGDRIALLVPPGPDLLVAAMATWRAGAVLVVADATAGIRSLRALIRAAGVRAVLGTKLTLGVSRATRMTPGATRLCFGPMPGAIDVTSPPLGPPPDAVLTAESLAAVVHTSGATGPAKPVRYTHGALSAQRDIVGSILAEGGGSAFTTSFPPFMLLAPVVGKACHQADFPLAHPGRLTLESLADVTNDGSVGTAWLSPASARNLVRTAAGRRAPVPLTLLAGAPIPRGLVASVADVTGGQVRAPYGMTECLPVTDGRDPERIGPLGGTSTGAPLTGCDVVIEPLTHISGSTEDDGDPVPVVGEILVAAPWMFEGYDARWMTDQRSEVRRQGKRFHRTGDVGYLHEGTLFQLGRMAHLLHPPSGPLGCLALELPLAEQLDREVAVVGVGPVGTQVIVAVLQAAGRLRPATTELAKRARACTSVPLAAVLLGSLPADRRHESKIDRTRLSGVVDTYLRGR